MVAVYTKRGGGMKHDTVVLFSIFQSLQTEKLCYQVYLLTHSLTHCLIRKQVLNRSLGLPADTAYFSLKVVRSTVSFMIPLSL